jgi:adenylate cyclase
LLAPDPAVDELVAAQLIDQTRYTPHAEYAFHHPLIQSVAYTTQLKSTRAQLHRRLADAIEPTDENAAFIAEHLESADDFADAYAWHMRAGAWSISRDITAAHTSWVRARQLADDLPTDYPNRADARIAPRVQISATAWRAGGSGGESGFEELRDLCTTAGDQRSLAMGMAGQIITLEVRNRRREASQLGSELTAVLERIGDTALTVAAGVSVVVAKFWTAEMTELLRVAELVIDASGGDVNVGNLVLESPVLVVSTLRGTARWCLGTSGWKDDLQASVTLSHQVDPATRAVVAVYTYVAAMPNGVLVADAAALRETADALAVLEQEGDNFSLNEARIARAVVLARQDGPKRSEAFELLAKVRDEVNDERGAWLVPPIIDTHIAEEKARTGDLDGAITLARSVLDDLYGGGGSLFCPPATTVLVQSLLARASDSDLKETQAVIDRLATASPSDPGMALIEVTSLRLKALLAQAQGNDARYRDFRDRYRKVASDLGYEGHIKWASEMA